VVVLKLQYLKHKELIKLFITTLGHPVILRQLWMKLHKVVIDWDNLKLLFTTFYCKQKCLVTCCSNPKQKSEKSIRIHQPKISTNVHHKESTRFHRPKNSTKFHQDRISADVRNGSEISADVRNGSEISANIC